MTFRYFNEMTRPRRGGVMEKGDLNSSRTID
jgi:hypothetical protein